MIVSFYASHPNYWRHLRPIYDDLWNRGVECRAFSQYPWHEWATPHLRPSSDLADVTVVASAQDADRVKVIARDVVYVEHGAGQTYEDGSRVGYAGGPQMGHVGRFVCPNDVVAAEWERTYPDARTRVVGCVGLHGVTRAPVVGSASVAWTAHWRCGVVPETWPALQDFAAQIEGLRADLADVDIELVGHAHPRDGRRLGEFWRKRGIRFEPDPDVILARSALIIGDNTSLLYEAAALDIPVLCLNRKEYRRDVEHGLRFWSHVPGLQCDRPADLIEQVWCALVDSDRARALRAKAVARAYAVPATRSAALAADFIVKGPG